MACDSSNQAAHYQSKFVACSLTALFSQKQLGKPMGQTSLCQKASALLGATAKTSWMFQPSYTSSSSYVMCLAVTHLPCPQTAGSPHVICSWLYTTYSQLPFLAGGCPSHGDRALRSVV